MFDGLTANEPQKVIFSPTPSAPHACANCGAVAWISEADADLSCGACGSEWQVFEDGWVPVTDEAPEE